MRRIVLLFSLMALMSVVAAGVAWAALQEGTDGPDTLNGTAQADRQFGLGGQDVLSGRGGNDKQNGGGGPDTIRGNAGDDTQKGSKGADTIIGGPGGDNVFAGGGADFVNVKDDQVQNDTVDCGPGDDTVRRDFILALPPRGDTIENCEHVVNN